MITKHYSLLVLMICAIFSAQGQTKSDDLRTLIVFFDGLRPDYELMQQSGSNMMVFSSGTTGQALMQNHKISGGAVINPEMIRPESLKEKVFTEIGQVQSAGGKHVWIANALMKYGIRMDGPRVSAIWFGDPDGTAHRDGIGSATAMAVIRAVDEQFGRVLADLESKGLANNFNILVSSDHGFVTRKQSS